MMMMITTYLSFSYHQSLITIIIIIISLLLLLLLILSLLSLLLLLLCSGLRWRPCARGRATPGPNSQPGSQVSAHNFAICFLLEIPLRGFPFQIRFSETYRIPKNSTNICFQRISFEKEIPSGGSQAGNMSQTSCPKAARQEKSPVSDRVGPNISFPQK